MQKNRRSTTALAAASAIAVCSAGAAQLAIAACSFVLDGGGPLGQDIGGGRHLVQYTPAGKFLPADGRAMDVASWYIDAAVATEVIARHAARGQPTVIDYEHQTLHKEKNGQPAPAAGWLHGLRWMEGRGLFGEVEWTEDAKAQIEAKKYRYFSPVFQYDKTSGNVLAIHMGAVTNHPGLHGLEPLSLLAAATAAFLPASQEKSTMNPLLAAVLAAFGLPATTDEKGAIAALTAVGSIKDLQTKASAGEAATQVATAACTALSLPADAKPEAVTAALTAVAAGKPNPAEYAPVAALTALQTQLAALTAKQLEADIDSAIQPALADGRLQPTMEPWARELGKTNMTALTSYLATAQPIAALTSTQTQGKQPENTAKGAHGLDASEVAVCTAMGINPEDFAKSKAAA
ncbi:UNVERIFIED_ORG: phage I-like protein [Comamonas terrigena]